MTLKNNRAPLLSIIKLYASFHHHMWIQTGVTVRKRLSWVVTSVTLTFDLWPWPFAWTSLLSLVITPENFMMIPWWEHSQKGVTDRQTDGRTDRQTDGRTDWTIHRAAWSQLKILLLGINFFVLSHSLWVIFVKFSHSTTPFGYFCENLILRLGLKFTLRILRLGWNFIVRTPPPTRFRAKCPPPQFHLTLHNGWNP